MVHLGFSDFFMLLVSNAGSIPTVSGGRGASNSLSGLANFRQLKFSDFLIGGFQGQRPRKSRHLGVKKPPH
jgi:hypothetical protein